MYEPRRLHTGLLVGLLLTVGGARAYAAARPTAQGPDGDHAFLKQALSVNELELRLGRLASQRAATDEVRGMGKKMIEKHTEFGQQLGELAKESGASVDPELSPDQQTILAGMESRTGADFDSAFKRTVDEGHEKELAMYQEEVSRAVSPRLRAVAEQRVAALKSSMAAALPQAGEKY